MGLWVTATLIFGFLESLTLALAVGVDAQDANPMMAAFSTLTRGTLWGCVVLKTVLLAGLLFLTYHLPPGLTWLAPALLCAVGSYLVLVNLVAFFTAI